MSKNKTPATFKRNPDTGLLDGVNYEYSEDGLIDWRKMVPLKFLYVNPSNKERIEKKYGKPYSEIDIEKDGVADTDLVILLAGIKYLLRLRGYENLISTIENSSDQYASVGCRITFVPNFETEGRVITHSDNACANLNNTVGFGKVYLVECATNRAFCRVVRSFLNINVVSTEEISSNSSNPSVGEEESEAPNMTKALYEKIEGLMEKKGKTLEDIKKKFFDGQQIADSIKEVKNLPVSSLVTIIEKLKLIKDKA